MCLCILFAEAVVFETPFIQRRNRFPSIIQPSPVFTHFRPRQSMLGWFSFVESKDTHYPEYRQSESLVSELSYSGPHESAFYYLQSRACYHW